LFTLIYVSFEENGRKFDVMCMINCKNYTFHYQQLLNEVQYTLFSFFIIFVSNFSVNSEGQYELPGMDCHCTYMTTWLMLYIVCH